MGSGKDHPPFFIFVFRQGRLLPLYAVKIKFQGKVQGKAKKSFLGVFLCVLECVSMMLTYFKCCDIIKIVSKILIDKITPIFKGFQRGFENRCCLVCRRLFSFKKNKYKYFLCMYGENGKRKGGNYGVVGRVCKLVEFSTLSIMT